MGDRHFLGISTIAGCLPGGTPCLDNGIISFLMRLPVKYFAGYFIVLFIVTNGNAQHITPGAIYLSELPVEGILLDTGWKFQEGDHLEWKDHRFNDSSWEDIDPTNEITYLPEIKKQPIGWLRLKLHVDSNLLHKPLAFQVYQTVASEIYLNGSLLKKYGVVSTDEIKLKR